MCSRELRFFYGKCGEILWVCNCFVDLEKILSAFGSKVFFSSVFRFRLSAFKKSESVAWKVAVAKGKSLPRLTLFSSRRWSGCGRWGWFLRGQLVWDVSLWGYVSYVLCFPGGVLWRLWAGMRGVRALYFQRFSLSRSGGPERAAENFF